VKRSRALTQSNGASYLGCQASTQTVLAQEVPISGRDFATALNAQSSDLGAGRTSLTTTQRPTGLDADAASPGRRGSDLGSRGKHALCWHKVSMPAGEQPTITFSFFPQDGNCGVPPVIHRSEQSLCDT
jgi:hypothetical protein